MRIEKLILKNWATIYTAMDGAQHIEIDFGKSKNIITLFLGPNGCGKTSVLSTLHPFAYSGSFDTRNDKNLFLDDSVGYKEIHYSHNGSLYIIKHHYTPTKTGRSVKSFISKDGIEMNANGNVTSFKEIILSELCIYEDYLRLIRLGPNVINFADMKTAARKDYVVDLMDDIDIYSKYYKKINDDNRYLKNTLTNVVNKLERLHIVNLDEEKNNLSNMEVQLEKVENLLNKATFKSGQIQSKIETYTGGNEATFVANYKETKSSLTRVDDDIRKIEDWINKVYAPLDKTVTKVIDKTIMRVEKEIIQIESSKEANMLILDNLYTSKTNKENQLKNIKSKDEINELTKNLKDYKARVVELEKTYNFENSLFNCSKDDLLLALSLLQEIQNIAQDIYEYGSKSVKEAIKMIQSNRNIEAYVAKKVTSIDETMGKLNVKRGYENEGVVVMFIPPTCETNKCPYYRRYHENKNEDELGKKITKLEQDRDYYLSLVNINKKIDYIFMIIRSNKSLIDRLPDNYFAITPLLDKLSKLESIYDEDYITEQISLIEEFDEYKNTKALIGEIEKELSYIKNSGIDIEIIQQGINNDIIEINRISNLNEEYRVRLVELENKLEGYNDIQNICEEFEDKSIILKELKIDYNDLVNKVNLYVQQISEIKTLKSEETEIKTLIGTYQRQKERLLSEINNIRFRIREFNTLQDEINSINEKFEEIRYIRSALSSNEGIPLLFVQLYFQETKKIVNDLLDMVYHGDIEIGDFDIDDSKFDVPFFRNSLRIDDINNASQGERNFFSLALSFSLMIQSHSSYNVMLLDEIDGPFDTRNREKFISILEAQIQSIGAEQVFLISHNNTFDNYAVNVVNFGSDNELDNYKNITQLRIVKK